MRVQLIGRPQFLGLPAELGTPRADQLQGSDAMKLIETAGRACYDSFGKGRSSAAYAEHILEVEHGSVLAHATYTFFITGVSRGLSHELVRHGAGIAISQRSTRYVDESESPWIMHPLLTRYLTETGNNDVAMAIEAAEAAGRAAYRLIGEKLEADLKRRGVDGLTARKQARGAARGYLGNALETELIWSANVRALRWVVSQRASAAADAEIRALGIALLGVAQAELPEFFEDYEVVASPDGLGTCARSPHPKV